MPRGARPGSDHARKFHRAGKAASSRKRRDAALEALVQSGRSVQASPAIFDRAAKHVPDYAFIPAEDTDALVRRATAGVMYAQSCNGCGSRDPLEDIVLTVLVSVHVLSIREACSRLGVEVHNSPNLGA